MMMPKRISSLVALLLGSCTGPHSDQNTVVVYVSADEQIARQIFDAYTNKTGVVVEWVGDTESTKTTALVQRILREKNNPVADVFWSSEILGTIQLARHDALAPCTAQRFKEWPSEYRDSEYLWFGFSPRARVVAYDPVVTDVSELPLYWWQYDTAVIADPRFGTTFTHVSVMASFPTRRDELFKRMNNATYLGGNSATVQAVVDGVAKYAMTDSDDVYASQARGNSVAMYMPRHHDGVGGGTLLIPNTVAILQGCKHPINAEAFAAFLLSDEVAILLANSDSRNFPLQDSVKEMFPRLIIDDPLEVDFSVAEEYSAEAVQHTMELLAK